MRIVDRKTFLMLPAGTAFQKGKPWVWQGLCFKTDDKYENDFRYLDVDTCESDDDGEIFDRLLEMRDGGASYPIDQSSTRDGLFDDDDMFLIYDPGDIKVLQGYLEAALSVAEKARTYEQTP